MPYRAKCNECEQETGITQPFFEKKSSWLSSLFLGVNLENAVAYYETHPRSQPDNRPCSGSGKAVPKSYMRGAHSTTPDEDSPSWGRRR